LALTKKQEARALSADERDLVEKSHHPAVQELSDKELAELAKLVRARRDKARSLAQQQRREMRGRSSPRGASASTADHGAWTKAEVLASAQSRLNSEISRRDRMNARLSLVESARKALMMKTARQEDDSAKFNTRHAHDGMQAVTREKHESLIRPMERGRLRKSASVAQARRDAR
jgi:hypothetical protein